MTTKTYAQLGTFAGVSGTFLVAGWDPAGPGPLKTAAASAWRTYFQANLGTAATQDTGTSGDVIAKLNGANTWAAAQTFSNGLSGTLTGNVTGNVTGNTSGSSGSCTGNAATATALTSGDKAITGKLTTTGDVASGGAITVSGTSGGFTGNGSQVICNQSLATVGSIASGGAITVSGTSGGFTGDGTTITCNQSFYGAGDGSFANVINRSDRRIKTDIQDAPDTGALLDQFRVTTYLKAGRREMGVIAQEAEAFWPDVVVSSGDAFEGGEPLRGLCLADIQFAMLKELQALRRRVAVLEASA